MGILLLWILILGWGGVEAAAAQGDRLVLGGAHPWQTGTAKRTALDVVSGALEPREYKPYQNILRMLDKGMWFPRVLGFDKRFDYNYVLGEDPQQFFTLDDAPINMDGSPTTGYQPLARYTTYMNSAYPIDTGVPVRANRFVFYPIQEGNVPPVGNWFAGSPLKDTYMRAYRLSAARYMENEASIPYPTLPEPLGVILREDMSNYQGIGEVLFPLQPFRFFRLTNITLSGFSLAEIELYGEGFSPEGWYTSEIIDRNELVNFGGVFWDFEKLRWRKRWTWNGPERSEDFDVKRRVAPQYWKEALLDPEPVVWKEAPVSISVEVRAGKDDSPLIYHKITEIGEQVVTEKEYKSLRPPTWAPSVWFPLLPDMRGPITYDSENWSPWLPVAASGIRGIVPSGRYIQFRVKVYSDDPWAFGRLDSLWIEHSAPLAKEIVGEVCMQGEPAPPKGVAMVDVGKDTTFLYTLRAIFDSPRQEGGDAVRITTPTRPEFKGLWMGKPLQKVKEDSVAIGDRYIEVYLPRKVNRNDDPIQVAFRTAILAYGTQFSGELWNTQRADLFPQGVISGDAVDEITTNQLQVFVREKSLDVLTGVKVQPEVITPNGDGVNEVATITYTLSLVSGGVEVEVGIYNLAGSNVWVHPEEVKGSAYKREVTWGARDTEGKLVHPGVYVVQVRVRTDAGEFYKTRLITVVY